MGGVQSCGARDAKIKALAATDPAKTIIVTGAMGHFGSAVTARLAEKEGWAVVATDMKAGPSQPAEVWGPFAHRVQFVQLDLGDAENERAVEALVSRGHYVVHMGAYPGPAHAKPPMGIYRGNVADAAVEEKNMDIFMKWIDLGPERDGARMMSNYAYMSETTGQEIFRANTVGSQSIFQNAVKHRCKRVVFSSTAFAYGWCHDPRDFVAHYLPLDEEHPLLPIEHYGLSKKVGEEQIEMQVRCGGIGEKTADSWEDGGMTSFVVLRFPNSVWKGRDWACLPWAGPKNFCQSGGPIMWAYVHEDDVIEAHVRSVDLPENKLSGKIEKINLAAPDCRINKTTKELIENHWGTLGRPVPELKAPLEGYTSILKNEKAQKLLGIKFKTRREGYEQFSLASTFTLQSGELLDKSAFIVYQTYGILNEDKSNAILYPTCYSQKHWEHEKDIGPGDDMLFDSSKYFIISVNQLGNGLSFSPTTPDCGQKYPKGTVTYHDQVNLQQKLVNSLGITKLALVYGFSMGAMQALEWAVQFPDQVGAIVAVCGSAKTGEPNTKFLKSLQEALRNDPHAKVSQDGRITGFSQKPKEGVTKFANIYADWIFSKDFFPQEQWKHVGSPSEEVFRKFFVGDWLGNWDAMEYYVVSDCWLHGDVSKNSKHKGDLKAALGSIKAKVYLMPGTTDQYFVKDEILEESKMIPNCVFQPLENPMGHTAGLAAETLAARKAAVLECLKDIKPSPQK